jgi:outer membrane lipoprotein-sorting protein
MKYKILVVILFLTIVGFSLTPFSNVTAQDARQLVEESFDYVRGKASIATVDMSIHRPGWQRQMRIKTWTRGQKDSLFYIDAPAKDHGNGTLKKGRQMWMFNPKVNRVIKVPPSMMAQSWMGSDFSNNDLAKSDSLLSDYTHSIIATETHDGLKVYVIKSMPKPDAPVIWGMQRLRVRQDMVWLSQEFFDEALQPVKAMRTLEIQMLGGRLFPRVWRMQKNDEIDQFTQLSYRALTFKPNLADSIFTLANLRKPQR